MNKPITLLLAEDEISLGTIIKESLETRGFEVSYCTDGEKTLSQFSAQKPDILVLDVMMPKIDGFTVAKKIRTVDANTPIIFLTAKSQTKDVIEGFNLGGNDYLKKPFSMEELIVRIHALLKRNKLSNSKEKLPIGSYLFNYIGQKLVHKKNRDYAYA